MTAREMSSTSSLYEVSVAGAMPPALIAAFSGLTVRRRPACTVFRLRLESATNLADIAAQLHSRGHLLLSARRVPTDDDE